MRLMVSGLRSVVRCLPAAGVAAAVGLMAMLTLLSQQWRTTGSGSMRNQGVWKEYLNIALPADTIFPPIVLSANDDEAIVARQVQQDTGRVIQVLKVRGRKLEFLGRQGNSLREGQDLALDDARQAPDGRIWVIVRRRGGLRAGFLVYRYDGQEWSRVGPEDGFWVERCCGPFRVRFLGNSEPVVWFFDGVDHRLARLARGKLRPLEIQRLLGWGTVRFGNDDLWIVGQGMGGGTSVSAWHIKGPRAWEVEGPFFLEEFGSHVEILHLAVSDREQIAAIGRAAGGALFGRVYTRADGGSFRALTFDLPERFTVLQMEWSRNGSLFVMGHPTGDVNTLLVQRLDDKCWEVTARGHQGAGGGMIFWPIMFIRPDGLPIVVWDEHFRCGLQ